MPPTDPANKCTQTEKSSSSAGGGGVGGDRVAVTAGASPVAIPAVAAAAAADPVCAWCEVNAHGVCVCVCEIFSDRRQKKRKKKRRAEKTLSQRMTASSRAAGLVWRPFLLDTVWFMSNQSKDLKLRRDHGATGPADARVNTAHPCKANGQGDLFGPRPSLNTRPCPCPCNESPCQAPQVPRSPAEAVANNRPPCHFHLPDLSVFLAPRIASRGCLSHMFQSAYLWTGVPARPPCSGSSAWTGINVAVGGAVVVMLLVTSGQSSEFQPEMKHLTAQKLKCLRAQQQ